MASIGLQSLINWLDLCSKSCNKMQIGIWNSKPISFFFFFFYNSGIIIIEKKTGFQLWAWKISSWVFVEERLLYHPAGPWAKLPLKLQRLCCVWNALGQNDFYPEGGLKRGEKKTFQDWRSMKDVSLEELES